MQNTIYSGVRLRSESYGCVVQDTPARTGRPFQRRFSRITVCYTFSGNKCRIL